MNQSWGYYEASILHVSPQNWVSKIVILLHFTAINMYQEAHILSNQDYGLCGEDVINWYTV